MQAIAQIKLIADFRRRIARDETVGLRWGIQ